MTRSLCALVLAASASLTASVLAQNPQATPDDGKREFVVSGCLLRAGYAGYKLEDAKVESVAGKAVAPNDTSPVAKLKNWTLEGGGNLGPRAGEKVEVTGRTDWTEAAETEGPAAKPPVLEVKAVKTVAASCS